MIKQIKNIGNKAIDQVNTETHPAAKPFKYAGGIMLIGGIVIDVISLFTPALPAGIIDLSSKLITVGGLLFGGSALTNKYGSQSEKTGILGTLKNLITK